jgi:hypothetical protein
VNDEGANVGEAKRRKAAGILRGARPYRPQDVSKLPGYQPDPDNDGYSFDTPTERFAIRGATALDELFWSEKYGRLNVSKALKNIRLAGAEPILTKITEGLQKHVAHVEVDINVVQTMSEARRDEPVIMLVASDGVNMIDGHHRLARRIMDGVDFVHAYILMPETLEYMQVRFYREGCYGNWIEEDPPNMAKIKREIEGGQLALEQLRTLNSIG